MSRHRRTDQPQVTLCARVDSYDVQSGIGFNVHLLGRIRADLAGDIEVFEATTKLVIGGVLYMPKERSGERIEVTLYGQKTTRSTLRVEDVHARDKNLNRQYRIYRGERVPILDLPTGLTTIDRRRSDRVWVTWVFVDPRLVTNMLAILASGRTTFLSLYEKMSDRHRWVTDVTLQTDDPAAED